jgi:hypothetical protein
MRGSPVLTRERIALAVTQYALARRARPAPPDAWALHPGQQRAHDSQAQVVSVLAGTGGGKTSYAPRWCYREYERTRGSGLIVAPHKILRRTTMPAFLGYAAHLGEWESKVDGIWRWHAGGYVYFASADTPESIEGAHVSWAWLDEHGQRQFPRQAWEAVQRRVRYHRGRILGTTTPYVVGWLKELWDDWRNGDRPDVEFISWSSNANPGFPQEEFERARATSPEWQFRMFYLAEWDRPAGLVYAEANDDSWVSGLPEGASDWPLYAGLDFGFHNPTAIVYARRSPDDVLYICDEYYESGRTDAENARAAPVGCQRAWGDPSAPEAIREFGQQGWRIAPCERHEVKAGIVEVLERLRSGRLKFARAACSELARELDSYVWDDRRPDTVVKEHDHACDALRYLCWGLRRPRRLRAF